MRYKMKIGLFVQFGTTKGKACFGFCLLYLNEDRDMNIYVVLKSSFYATEFSLGRTGAETSPLAVYLSYLQLGAQNIIVNGLI